MPAEKRNIRSDFYKQRLSAANQPAAFIGGGYCQALPYAVTLPVRRFRAECVKFDGSRCFFFPSASIEKSEVFRYDDGESICWRFYDNT